MDCRVKPGNDELVDNRSTRLTNFPPCTPASISVIGACWTPFNAEFTSIRDPGVLDEGCLSMTMRRDHRAIGGMAGRSAPHAALILAGLLLLIRP
jgi:hypothetical protein